LDPVEIRLAPPFSILVAMDWGDGEDPAGPRPKVRLDVNPLDRQPIPYPSNAGDKIDGLFPGRYSFPNVLFVPGYSLTALTLDGRDVMGREVVVSGESSLRVVLRKDVKK